MDLLHLLGNHSSFLQSKVIDLFIPGHFPHLFSKLENLDYSGPIPDKKYFDLTFSCRSKQDFDEFNDWHASWTGEWNYLNQRELYCRNDVLMLKQIVFLYNQGLLNSLPPHLKVSPWFFPTMAGHVHAMFIHNMNYGKEVTKMTKEQITEYANNTMCGLEAEEHYYARTALRGGMTNICKYIYKGKFHYQDIQSSYPSVQMDVNNLYPIGPPIIEIHNPDYYPCSICFSKLTCSHTKQQKEDSRIDKRQNLNIVHVQVTDLETYCQTFFGIITIDVVPPPNLYHPLIQEFDESRKKVIGSLRPIKACTIPSNTLHEAIRIGYKVTKIHRADRYKSAESYWRDGFLGNMYLNKMRNSGSVKPQDQSRIKKFFADNFKIDCSDIADWKKNPVLKQIAKGPVTAAWGKHAESTDHDQAITLDSSSQDAMMFYKSLLLNYTEIKNIRMVGVNTLFNYKENRDHFRPNLSKGYVPASVFVTAYGRIKLWKELVKIDPLGTPNPRVLMYDTDSIVYECSGDCTEQYHIEEGDCLGQWETEDLETENQGLKEFYAIGPKSYSIVCGNGKTLLKLKGATIKHAHKNLISPEIMRDLVISKTPGKVAKAALLPQMYFDWSVNKGMTTRYAIKKVEFNEDDVKGDFCFDDYRAYPYGYNV